MADFHEVGKTGEALAANYLRFHGFTILFLNWRHGRYELDMVALDRQYLVFVEVKTRSFGGIVYPEDAVTRSKQQKLYVAAKHYLEVNEFNGPIRFDVVSVHFLPHGKRLFYHPDAFFPLG